MAAKQKETNINYSELEKQAKLVLAKNNIGSSTKPAPRLYPHQWFWDSCFIAIGLASFDTKKAKTELRSLVSGQWYNGMIPHIVFSDAKGYHYGPERWRSFSYQQAPDEVQTSCLTQPPMLAEAVVRVGSKLSNNERQLWYQEMYPHVLKLHEWLYGERDPYERGLVCLVHPWESGMDNTPSWSALMKKFIPKYASHMEKMKLQPLLSKIRKDTADSKASERPTASELFAFYKLIKKLQVKKFSIDEILATKLPLVEDLAFNAITIQANNLLEQIATETGQTLPPELVAKFELARKAFLELSDDSGNWYSRNARTKEFIKEPTNAQFLALYSRAISEAGADSLASQLKDKKWWPKYGVTTTPTDSAFFKPKNYWQGPVWVNINWLIADGLKHYGH